MVGFGVYPGRFHPEVNAEEAHERLIQKGGGLVQSVATKLTVIEIGMVSTPRNWGGAAKKAACAISWMRKLKG